MNDTGSAYRENAGDDFWGEFRRLREAPPSLGLRPIAARVGISYSTLSRWERLRQQPNLVDNRDAVPRLIAALAALKSLDQRRVAGLYEAAGIAPVIEIRPGAMESGPIAPILDHKGEPIRPVLMLLDAAARVLDTKGDWNRAQSAYVQSAARAEADGDYVTWAKNLLAAGQSAASRGRYDAARRWYDRVIGMSPAAIENRAIVLAIQIEARVRLGIMHLDLGYLDDAYKDLREALNQLHRGDWFDQVPAGNLTFHQILSGSVEAEGRRLRIVLEYVARHYLGRYYVEKGLIAGAVANDATDALSAFDAATRLAHQVGLTGGIDHVRRILPLRTFSESDARRLLNAREEMLTGIFLATSKGAIASALFFREDEPRRARRDLESAYESAIQPIFSAPMAAKSLRLLAEIELADDRSENGIIRAIELLFLALAFNPDDFAVQSAMRSVREAARWPVRGSVLRERLVEFEGRAWTRTEWKWSDLNRLIASLGEDLAIERIDRAVHLTREIFGQRSPLER